MALTNSQHDAIMRSYNYTQAENRRRWEARTREVYRLHPDIRAADDAIIALSAESGPAIIQNNASLQEFQTRLEALNRQRARLLSQYGYAPDYLEEIHTCELCRDTGYADGRKCRCFSKKAVDLLYTQSNLKNTTARENFDHFRPDYYSNDPQDIDPATGLTPYENMKKIFSKAQDFVADFDSCRENLLFYGGTGTGKTFLSNCIADVLLKSVHSVIYLTAIELFDTFSSQDFRIANTDKDLPDSHYVLDCDLLIIDDLGTELQNSFSDSRLFYCLNERILRGNSTIISTNLKPSHLRDRYGERILSRISSNYKILYLYGSDIRLQKKQALIS